MSGFECFTAILGVAGMGIQLSATLYDFASTTSGAKDDMNMIAESIDTYSSVLETLGRQLEASQAVCSVEGLRLAQDLERQSQVLFQKIAENIPQRSDKPSMRQKVSWYFQRDRVNFLLGQIEQLKATVSLLLQILILAQTTQPRTQTQTTTNNVTNNVNINVNVVNAEISSQFRRAENRVMQYHNASVKFARLQMEDEEPVVRNALPWKEEFEELPVVRRTNGDDDIAATFGQLALQQPRMSSADANANSAQLVNTLLDQWTTIETHTEGESMVDNHVEAPEHEIPISTGITSTKDITIDPISHADTVADLTYPSEPVSQKSSPPVRSLTTASTVTTSTGNPVKGWWQKYRQSQKKDREAEERQRELDNQERELLRRETQLQREQTLVERELKLHEKQREQEAAQAKALVEREARLQESQRLKEAALKQSLAEKELRAQEAQKQREATREHVARLRELRHRPLAITSRSQGQSQVQIQNQNSKGVGGGESIGGGGISRASTTTSLDSPFSSTTTMTTANNGSRPPPPPPPPYRTLSDQNSTATSPGTSASPTNLPWSPSQSQSHFQPSLLSRASTTPIGSSLALSLTPTTSSSKTSSTTTLTATSTLLQNAKEARKQRRADRKSARKIGKKMKKNGGNLHPNLNEGDDDNEDDDDDINDDENAGRSVLGSQQ